MALATRASLSFPILYFLLSPIHSSLSSSHPLLLSFPTGNRSSRLPPTSFAPSNSEAGTRHTMSMDSTTAGSPKLKKVDTGSGSDLGKHAPSIEVKEANLERQGIHVPTSGPLAALWRGVLYVDKFGVEVRGIERVRPEDRSARTISDLFDAMWMWMAANSVRSSDPFHRLEADLTWTVDHFDILPWHARYQHLLPQYVLSLPACGRVHSTHPGVQA